MAPRLPPTPASCRVCDLLKEHRTRIGDAFVRILKEEVGPHYASRSVEELRETSGAAVAAYLAVVCAGDWVPMDAFIKNIAEARFPLHFPLSEVQRAFAVFRQIVHPILTETCPGPELDEVLALLDKTVDEAIHRFSDVYQQLHLDEIRSKSAELSQAHERLREQYKEVAEAARIKNQFFANMSHELRSPLNSVIGYTELLLDGIEGPLTDDQKGDLQKILASSRYLLKLINNILDMTKIESGRMEVEIRPFRVREVLDEVLDTVAPLAYRKKIELRADVEKGAETLASDRDKVKQILINLFANAVKFTEEGEVACTVEAEGDGLRFGVRDTGIGFAEEERDRIFSKFYQIDNVKAREHRGTGLGLPLVRMLVELLEGRLEVESREGRGSLFRFWIPQAELATDPLQGQEAVDGLERRTVLVIEDDPLSLELIRRLVESEGMRAVAARSGPEGLSLARTARPSVITLDLLMPHLDGWETLEQLKSDPATREIPVAIVSCVDRKARGLRAGADAFVVKPIDREEFVTTLRRLAGSAGVGGAS